jgi:hypothetical protein
MLNLRGKDYKIVGELIILMDTLEVFLSNGKLLGKLASADFPRVPAKIRELLKPVPKKEVEKIEKRATYKPKPPKLSIGKKKRRGVRKKKIGRG